MCTTSSIRGRGAETPGAPSLPRGTGSVLLGQLGRRGGVVHPDAADPGVALHRAACSAVGATHPNDAASLRAPPPDAYLPGRTTRRRAAVPFPGESARFLQRALYGTHRRNDRYRNRPRERGRSPRSEGVTCAGGSGSRGGSRADQTPVPSARSPSSRSSSSSSCRRSGRTWPRCSRSSTTPSSRRSACWALQRRRSPWPRWRRRSRRWRTGWATAGRWSWRRCSPPAPASLWSHLGSARGSWARASSWQARGSSWPMRSACWTAAPSVPAPRWPSRSTACYVWPGGATTRRCAPGGSSCRSCCRGWRLGWRWR